MPEIFASNQIKKQLKIHFLWPRTLRADILVERQSTMGHTANKAASHLLIKFTFLSLFMFTINVSIGSVFWTIAN